MNNQQAFPHEFRDGMTLRDYMAAKAMQGMCANPNSKPEVGEDVFAEAAYMMADAMLKARKE